MKPIVGCILLAAGLLLSGCGSGGSFGGDPPVTVSGAPAVLGIFDPSLTENGATLWMSFSTVNVSPNDPVLPHISTRIASSTNGGSSWNDAGVAPNFAQDILIIPGFPNPNYWATWQFEVSRLIYDPHDSDNNRRWKLLWHRYLNANPAGTAQRWFDLGWIGYSTAPSTTGPWSAERKLFVGSGYNTVSDSVIGVPEYDLASTFAGLSGCQFFTEPGMLATASGVYISLHCLGTVNKVVLLRCTGNFAPNNCTYLGDLLDASEAQQFAPAGETYNNGFSATELVASAGRNFLIVTPVSGDEYRGCLVFEISDLDNATLVRASGDPVLITRIGGSSSLGFHGACGYTPGTTATGIVYGKASATVSPPFRLYGSGLSLP